MIMGRPSKQDPETRPAWARRIADVRKKAGWSQVSIAEHIGKSQSQVGEYETGKSQPDFPMIERIAKACNVHPGWLIFGDGGPDQGDAEWGPLFRRYKDHPLFAFVFKEAAIMLAEEGVKADFAYLMGYTTKLLAAAEGADSGAGTEDSVRRSVEAERMEIRQKMDALRKNLL